MKVKDAVVCDEPEVCVSGERVVAQQDKGCVNRIFADLVVREAFDDGGEGRVDIEEVLILVTHSHTVDGLVAHPRGEGQSLDALVIGWQLKHPFDSVVNSAHVIEVAGSVQVGQL